MLKSKSFLALAMLAMGAGMGMQMAAPAATKAMLASEMRTAPGAAQRRRKGSGIYRPTWSYPVRGWSVAEGKRRARKARNVRAHKRHLGMRG